MTLRSALAPLRSGVYLRPSNRGPTPPTAAPGPVPALMPDGHSQTTPSDASASGSEPRTCSLCGFEGVRTRQEAESPSLHHISCNRCSDYLVTQEAAEHLSRIRRREGGADQQYPELVGRLHLISGHTRELRLMGGGPAHLTEAGATAVVRAAPSHVVDRLDRFLLNLARMSPRIGRELEIRAAWDQPLGYCRDLEELVAFVVHLAEAGLIRCDRRSFTVAKEGRLALTVAGWERVRELRHLPRVTARRIGFVAIGGNSPDGLWENGIHPGVEAAGYVAYRPFPDDGTRVLSLESAARIRESRFVVADVSDHDPWVYAAGAFGQGVGVPVIWTCREGEASTIRVEAGSSVVLPWAWPEVLRSRLAPMILALLGRGPRWEHDEGDHPDPSPPATTPG